MKNSIKNIGCFRPKDGISADYFFKILGKKSKVDIKRFSIENL